MKLERVPLLRGDYTVIAFVGDENAITVFDRRDLRPAFSMAGDRYEIGLISVSHRWESSGAALAEVREPALLAAPASHVR